MTLDKLKQVAKAATQGRWEGYHRIAQDTYCIKDKNDGIMWESTSYGNNFYDTKHIATFNPATVLALLSYIEALESECFSARKTIHYAEAPEHEEFKAEFVKREKEWGEARAKRLELKKELEEV